MGLGYFLVALVAVGVTVFALQNTDPATVRFLFWHIERVPIAVLVLASFGVGLVIAAVPLGIKLGIWRSRARSREARVGVLEAAAAERDRQALRPPLTPSQPSPRPSPPPPPPRPSPPPPQP